MRVNPPTVESVVASPPCVLRPDRSWKYPVRLPSNPNQWQRTSANDKAVKEIARLLDRVGNGQARHGAVDAAFTQSRDDPLDDLIGDERSGGLERIGGEFLFEGHRC